MKIVLSIVFLAIGGISAARPRRLIGGVPISIEKASYFVSLRSEKQIECNGALIAPKYVLTAAHCILDEDNLYPRLVVMVDTDKNTGGTPHMIADRFYPCTFRRSDLRDDIAVLRLREAVRLSETVKPIALPRAERNYYEKHTLIGFESRTTDDMICSLRQFDVHIYPSSQCQAKEYSNNPKHPTIFCGTPDTNGIISTGDSGGPLVRNEEIVGVTSWASQKGYKLTYWTNVYHYLTFIKQAMRKKSDCIKFHFRDLFRE